MTPRLHPDGRPTDSLRHLRPLADISLSPSVTTSTVPHNERTHRRLVRLGRVLLVLGPSLIMSHILSDTQFAGETAVWTYTLASYDVAVVVTIIGAALTWRTPPAEQMRSR